MKKIYFSPTNRVIILDTDVLLANSPEPIPLSDEEADEAYGGDARTLSNPSPWDNEW